MAELDGPAGAGVLLSGRWGSALTTRSPGRTGSRRLEERHVRRKIGKVDAPSRVDAVLQHPTHQVTGRCSCTVPGFVDNSGSVLVVADWLSGGFATVDIGGDLFAERQELGLVVEHVDHHVAALMTIGVVPVVPHDETPDAVVLDIDTAHSGRLGRRRHSVLVLGPASCRPGPELERTSPQDALVRRRTTYWLRLRCSSAASTARRRCSCSPTRRLNLPE